MWLDRVTRPVQDEAWLSLLEELSRELGLHRRVRLLQRRVRRCRDVGIRLPRFLPAGGADATWSPSSRDSSSSKLSHASSCTGRVTRSSHMIRPAPTASKIKTAPTPLSQMGNTSASNRSSGASEPVLHQPSPRAPNSLDALAPSDDARRRCGVGWRRGRRDLLGVATRPAPRVAAKPARPQLGQERGRERQRRARRHRRGPTPGAAATRESAQEHCHQDRPAAAAARSL